MSLIHSRKLKCMVTYTMSENLLGVKLISRANLTKTQIQIVNASTATTDYTAIKAT